MRMENTESKLAELKGIRHSYWKDYVDYADKIHKLDKLARPLHDACEQLDKAIKTLEREEKRIIKEMTRNEEQD